MKILLLFILLNFNLCLYCDDFQDFESLLQKEWNFEEHIV